MNLATPNPRARPIDYIPRVITYGQATNEERCIVL